MCRLTRVSLSFPTGLSAPGGQDHPTAMVSGCLGEGSVDVEATSQLSPWPCGLTRLVPHFRLQRPVRPQASTRTPVSPAFDDKLVESPGGASALLPDFLTPFSYFLYFPSGHFNFLFPVFRAIRLSRRAYCLSGLPPSPSALLRENKRPSIRKMPLSVPDTC